MIVVGLIHLPTYHMVGSCGNRFKPLKQVIRVLTPDNLVYRKNLIWKGQFLNIVLIPRRKLIIVYDSGYFISIIW